MTIHVLIQCSKKKSQIPENNLIWSRITELNSWKEEWVNEEKRFLVTKLYTGRSIKKEFDLADATQIAIFPDKYVDPKDVGTFYQDTRPINKEGYKIDEKLKEEVQQNRLKNPQSRSAQQRAEGLS